MRVRSDRVAPSYRVLTASKSSVRPAMLIRRAILLLPKPRPPVANYLRQRRRLVAINVRQCVDGFTLSPDIWTVATYGGRWSVCDWSIGLYRLGR